VWGLPQARIGHIRKSIALSSRVPTVSPADCEVLALPSDGQGNAANYYISMIAKPPRRCLFLAS
jgi:hypothetical protein